MNSKIMLKRIKIIKNVEEDGKKKYEKSKMIIY